MRKDRPAAAALVKGPMRNKTPGTACTHTQLKRPFLPRPKDTDRPRKEKLCAKAGPPMSGQPPEPPPPPPPRQDEEARGTPSGGHHHHLFAPFIGEFENTIRKGAQATDLASAFGGLGLSAAARAQRDQKARSAAIPWQNRVSSPRDKPSASRGFFRSPGGHYDGQDDQSAGGSTYPGTRASSLQGWVSMHPEPPPYAVSAGTDDEQDPCCCTCEEKKERPRGPIGPDREEEVGRKRPRPPAAKTAGGWSPFEKVPPPAAKKGGGTRASGVPRHYYSGGGATRVRDEPWKDPSFGAGCGHAPEADCDCHLNYYGGG